MRFHTCDILSSFCLNSLHLILKPTCLQLLLPCPCCNNCDLTKVHTHSRGSTHEIQVRNRVSEGSSDVQDTHTQGRRAGLFNSRVLGCFGHGFQGDTMPQHARKRKRTSTYKLTHARAHTRTHTHARTRMHARTRPHRRATAHMRARVSPPACAGGAGGAPAV